MVLQQLPGRRLRRPEPPLLVLLRAAPGLVAPVLAAGRDPRLPARGRARARRRPPDRDRRHGQRVRVGRRAAAAGRSRRPTGATYEADALILATGQLHQPSLPPDRGRRDVRRATASTRPNGTTTTRSRASAWRSSARARARSSSCPRSRQRCARLTVFQRTGNWFLPRKNRPYPASSRRPFERIPGLQALRRRFVFEYGESLTLAIRHPRTVGRLGAARSAAFMRMQLSDPEVRRKAWPDYTFGCKRILFSSDFLPALQRRNVELVTDADRAPSRPRASSPPTGARHEVDCIIWATGFRTNDFMFPMEITGADGLSLHECWARRRTRAPRHHRARLPEHVRPLRPQHQHLRRLDHLLPRDAGRLRPPGARSSCAARRRARSRCGARSRPRATGRCRRASRAPPGRECDSWYRDEQGRIVANWPGYMREYLRAGQHGWMRASTASCRCPTARRSRASEERGGPMHDYVIVGAGSAGCVLANRLSEDPSVRVLLLEAGGEDRSPNIKIPAAFPEQFHTKLDWDFATEPEPHVDGRALYIPRGKALGGSQLDERDALRARAPAGLRRLGGAGRAWLGLPRRAPLLHQVRGQRRAAPRSTTARAARCTSPSSARRARSNRRLLEASEARGHPAHRRLQRPRAGRRLDVPGHPDERPALQRRRRLPAAGAEPPQPRGPHQRRRCSASSSKASARSACACARAAAASSSCAPSARCCSAPARSARRSCCCSRASDRPRSCARRASRSATTCRASGATSRTTRS